jgi:hypothetical protein
MSLPGISRFGAVALLEWVDGVDLTEVAGQPLGERVQGQAAQEAGSRG